MKKHLEAALSVAAIALATGAPTAGDIGGCGQRAALLDDAKFFAEKARIDCDRCQTCGLVTDRCEVACGAGDGADQGAVDASERVDERFPVGCRPLVHDGEVCLRALADASCDAYASYVADVDATTPTECAFCPLRSAAGAAR